MTEDSEVVQQPTNNEPETDELLGDIDKAIEEADKSEKIEAKEEKPSKKDVPEEADDNVVKTDKVEDDETSKDENKPKDKPEEDETTDNEEKSEKEPVELPRHMDKNLKELLSDIKDKKVVDAHLKVFKRMESTYSRKHTDFKKMTDFSNNVHRKFNEYGLGKQNKLQYVENFLKFDNKFTKNPKQAIKLLLKQANLKAEDLIDESEEYLTDGEKQFKQGLQKIDNLRDDIQLDRKKKAQDKIIKEFDDFRNETESDGKLKRPYVKQVMKGMMDLMNTYPDYSWQELYDKACRLDDDISNEIRDKKLKSELEKQEAERKKKIKKAEKIKKQNLSTRNLDTHPSSEDEFIRNLVDDAFDNA